MLFLSKDVVFIMALIDKKQESYYIKNNEVVHMFNANDVKEAVLEFKKVKCYCTATAPFICDFCSTINKIFGDFEK